MNGATGPGRAKLKCTRVSWSRPVPEQFAALMRLGPAGPGIPRDEVRPRTKKRQRKALRGKGPGKFANVQAPQPPGKIRNEFIRLVGKAKAPPRDLAPVLAALFAGVKSGRRYRARCPRVGVSPG